MPRAESMVDHPMDGCGGMNPQYSSDSAYALLVRIIFLTIACFSDLCNNFLSSWLSSGGSVGRRDTSGRLDFMGESDIKCGMRMTMKKRKKIQLMRDVLIFFLALILHFEEWVWNRVTPVFTFFARLRIIQRFEDSIRKLDPYASLSLFLVPAGMTLLAKIWAFEIMAKGHIVT